MIMITSADAVTGAQSLDIHRAVRQNDALEPTAFTNALARATHCDCLATATQVGTDLPVTAAINGRTDKGDVLESNGETPSVFTNPCKHLTATIFTQALGSNSEQVGKDVDLDNADVATHMLHDLSVPEQLLSDDKVQNLSFVSLLLSAAEIAGSRNTVDEINHGGDTLKVRLTSASLVLQSEPKNIPALAQDVCTEVTFVTPSETDVKVTKPSERVLARITPELVKTGMQVSAADSPTSSIVAPFQPTDQNNAPTALPTRSSVQATIA